MASSEENSSFDEIGSPTKFYLISDEESVSSSSNSSAGHHHITESNKFHEGMNENMNAHCGAKV